MEAKTKFSLVVAGAILAGSLFASSAQASTVAYEDVGFIRGVGFENDSFTVDSNGKYRVTLTDFNFPNSFDELQLMVSTYDTPINTIVGAGAFDFDAKVGTTYFTNVYGVAGGPLDLGLYGIGVEALNSSVPAVPLPASLLLMSSALVALGAFGRGGRGLDAGSALPEEALPA